MNFHGCIAYPCMAPRAEGKIMCDACAEAHKNCKFSITEK